MRLPLSFTETKSFLPGITREPFQLFLLAVKDLTLGWEEKEPLTLLQALLISVPYSWTHQIPAESSLVTNFWAKQ